jgi:hypothetical protein
MTRFVTYDREVAARLARAVGVHRVELRDAAEFNRKVNPALFDLVRSPARSAAMMASSDEQVLVVQVKDEDGNEELRAPKKRKKRSPEDQMKEIGSQPSGFLGLQDEPVFSDEQENPPRSLWKQDE